MTLSTIYFLFRSSDPRTQIGSGNMGERRSNPLQYITDTITDSILRKIGAKKDQEDANRVNMHLSDDRRHQDRLAGMLEKIGSKKDQRDDTDCEDENDSDDRRELRKKIVRRLKNLVMKFEVSAMIFNPTSKLEDHMKTYG